MLGHRVLNIEDYTTLLKKRGWIIAIPAILLLLVGWGITFFVPPQYLSQTLCSSSSSISLKKLCSPSIQEI